MSSIIGRVWRLMCCVRGERRQKLKAWTKTQDWAGSAANKDKLAHWLISENTPSLFVYCSRKICLGIFYSKAMEQRVMETSGKRKLLRSDTSVSKSNVFTRLLSWKCSMSKRCLWWFNRIIIFFATVDKVTTYFALTKKRPQVVVWGQAQLFYAVCGGLPIVPEVSNSFHPLGRPLCVFNIMTLQGSGSRFVRRHIKHCL